MLLQEFRELHKQKVQSLGHLALKVYDQDQAEKFYNEILGLPIVARFASRRMSFFSLGNHHDFVIAAIGNDASSPDGKGIGLQHVAFKIGNKVRELRAAKQELEAAGVEVTPVDHGVSKSLIFFHDPNGNRLEAYVDVSNSWRQAPLPMQSHSRFRLDRGRLRISFWHPVS